VVRSLASSVKRKLTMPYIPVPNIRHVSDDRHIDNCNAMLKCVCNVDCDWWKWSCLLLDRTCAEHIFLWEQ